MDLSSMNRGTKQAWALAAVLVVGGTSVWWQSRALAQLRLEQRRLADQEAEATRLRLENDRIPDLRNRQQEISRWRQDNQDLHRLRNDVRLLRDQVKGQEKTPAARPNPPAGGSAREPGPASAAAPGFVAKESFTFGGYASPEAAMQSFFWALREGQLDLVQQALTPEARQQLQAQPADQYQQMAAEMALLKSYRIAARKVVSENEVRLGLQVVFEPKPDELRTEETTLPLKRVGHDWKLDFAP
jgi:hypothetical protein